MELENTDLQVYKLKPSAFFIMRKKVILRIILLLLGMLAIIGAILISNGTFKNIDGSSVLIFCIALPFFLFYVLFRTFRRMKKVYETFTITITRDAIIREQANTPVLMIRNDEIKKIIRFKNGTICIKGDSLLNQIAIPEGIDGSEELEDALKKVLPLEPSSLMKSYGHILLFMLAVPVMMMMTVTSQNRVILIICGLLLVGYLAFSFYAAQESRNADNQTRKGSWWSLIMILFVIITVMMKLLSMKE
ncbi:MAG: hypothetical protein NTW29_14300 [Bacteroidetes bacterium]|nr:hypothetical protein [Bacteroidota bacterium]